MLSEQQQQQQQPALAMAIPAAQYCIAPSLAITACAFMAFLYVALLYAPSLLFCLPPPSSIQQHMLRRFASAFFSSLISLFLSFFLLPIEANQSRGVASLLNVYGVRSDHWWQAVLFPLLLTALLYSGPLVTVVLERFGDWNERFLPGECSDSGDCSTFTCWSLVQGARAFALDILAWRNFVVAPLTEEIVFRACMIPILLCTGIQHVAIIFLCPCFFGSAHFHHFWELVYEKKCGKKRALAIVGVQFGYTTVFGWYASFLYLRTGNLLAPLVAHIFCNVMGLPDLGRMLQKPGLIFILIGGIIGFFGMLGPASNPSLYNDFSGTCNCWLGYCKWR